MSAFPFDLASIDLDETLLGPDGRIGDANRRAVERLRGLGCRVVLGSGRRFEGMLRFQRDLGLRDYIVSAQGALVKHSESLDVLYEKPLGAALAAELVEEGLQRGFNIAYYADDQVYVDADSPLTDAYRDVAGVHVPVRELRSLRGTRPHKLIWLTAPAKVQAALPSATERYAGRANIAVTFPFMLEFAAVGADKALGIEAVAKHYAIPRQRVLAFGDGDNDVPLLAWAGLGVAMPHGKPVAKAAADLIAPEGDPESALARAVTGVLLAAGIR